MLPEPPRSAAQLRCPQCGAGVPPGGNRCDHCEAQVLVKACPRCFGRMFHGSAHCQHCGAAVEVPAAANAAGDAAPRACPRCRDRGASLEGRLVDGFLLDECNACSGVYVDLVTLERMIAERRQVGVELRGVALAGGTTPVGPQPAGAFYVRCPDCDAVMNRQHFGKMSGIIVDVCRSHGTWFDADELPGVIAFVQSGGLERAARRDLEREREAARRAKAEALAERLRAEHARSGFWGGPPRCHDDTTHSVAALIREVADLLID
jgi:Zn-finger nucleic acid-binding protein